MEKFLIRVLALLNVAYFPIGIIIFFIIIFILAVIESIRYKDNCVKEWLDGDCLKTIKIVWRYVIEQLKTGEFMDYNEFYDEELKNLGQ